MGFNWDLSSSRWVLSLRRFNDLEKKEEFFTKKIKNLKTVGQKVARLKSGKLHKPNKI